MCRIRRTGALILCLLSLVPRPSPHMFFFVFFCACREGLGPRLVSACAGSKRITCMTRSLQPTCLLQWQRHNMFDNSDRVMAACNQEPTVGFLCVQALSLFPFTVYCLSLPRHLNEIWGDSKSLWSSLWALVYRASAENHFLMYAFGECFTGAPGSTP